MTLPNLLVTIPSYEMAWFIIFLLAIAVGWLGVKLRRTNRGIEAMTRILETENRVRSPVGIPDIDLQSSGGRLARVLFNTVSEIALQKDLALGAGKVHSVLLDQVRDALFVIDENQEIRFANLAGRNLFPGTLSIVGRQLIEVCMDHHFTSTVEMAMQIREGSIQENVTMANDQRTFLIESGPIDPSWQIGAGAWLIARDITKELHTEQIRKDFVANASHELRTPLSIIKGYLEAIEDDPKHTHACQIMGKHTDRLTRIVEDMLFLSQIEDGEDSGLQNNTLFEIGDCVLDTVEQLRPMIEKQEARVEIELPPKKEDQRFYGDRFYWDQIFFNLLENALKQNPAPGLRIRIIVEKESNGRFKIRIIDNGVGIPASSLPEIFKRFYRVEKSHSQKIKGTGLGLSIVKRAVEAHNGTIHATSRPKQETCFTISLPGPPLQVQESTL